MDATIIRPRPPVIDGPMLEDFCAARAVRPEGSDFGHAALVSAAPAAILSLAAPAVMCGSFRAAGLSLILGAALLALVIGLCRRAA